MKIVLLLAAMVVHLVCFGQVHGGIQFGVSDCSLNGHSTLPAGGAAYSAGVWSELMPRDWVGVKADVSYTQRKGGTDEGAMRTDALLLSGLVRFHLQEIGSTARLVVGAGGFMQLPVFSATGVRALDAGPGVEIGLEYGRVAVVLYGQAGLADVVSGVEKKQRWVAVGVGVVGRIW